MAILNVSLNLLSGNSFKKAAGDVGALNSALGKTGGVLDGLKRKMDFTHKLMGFASASVLVSNFASGVKSAVGAVENLVGVVGNFANQGDKIAKTSRLVGLSVNDYQALGAAARHAGMSTEELDSALKKFNVNLGKARSGDKAAFKVFDAILGGRKVSDFKDSTELLKGVADGYAKLSTAEQKAFVSQELFGRSGLKMTEMLSGGSDAVQKMIEDFDALGGGFSEEGAKNAEAFDDALQDMRGTIESIKISVMQELFPTFTDLFKTVQAFVKDSGPKIKEQVGFVVNSVGGFVKGMLPYIPKVLGVVVKLVDTIGPGVLAIVAGVTGIITIMAPLIPGLMTVASLLSGPIMAALSAVQAIIASPIVIGIGLVVAGFVAWKKAITSIIDNFSLLSSFVMHDLPNSFGIFGKVLSGIGDLVAAIGFGFYKIFEFVTNLPSAISGIKGFLKDVPIIGGLLGSGESSQSAPALGSTVGQMVSESHTTTTNRFSVDFKNMPKGVQVTAPEKGDFDYSRGYVLGGV